MRRRSLHPLFLMLAFAVLAAQGVGAAPISGLMWCLGCPGDELVVSQACLPGQVAACCDKGESSDGPRTAGADASCGCTDVPVEREQPDAPRVQARAASDLPAAPLPSPLPLIVAGEPDARPFLVVEPHAPPRETVPRLRFTVLIV